MKTTYKFNSSNPSKDYPSVKEIKVGLNFDKKIIPVGRLATSEQKIYFEYDQSFIENKIEISPLKLPLQKGVTTSSTNLFDGLPGVFNDSLPDGWGRLLFDRLMASNGVFSKNLTPLDRLSYVGDNGIGALVYKPDYSLSETKGDAKNFINLDTLAIKSKTILKDNSKNVLQELLSLNGSSAGARPKALIGLDKDKKNIYYGACKLTSDYEYWLVKFTNSQDTIDAGAIEYVYALMAKKAGVNISEVHLFKSQHGAGYFSTKRFDRNHQKRFHMHTACGLLHSDFRTPCLDYKNLTALTWAITKDIREVEKMFRLAVFNVLAHNRDDHSKNFSFLMDKNGAWKLSPAYDITFSFGPEGEQSTMLMGEGKNPRTDHLIKLGLDANLDKNLINQAIDQTKNALSYWKKLAIQHSVSQSSIDLIKSKLQTSQK
ncbi:MAG: type II toxin-antitoxin system HipA family toxin [Bdellovibrionales bacterium]|nr:type II toxin-antitoxin system HipA family toxin [Bdellovibrionales bacterium]